MMRTILFLSVCVFIFTPVFAMAGDVTQYEAAVEVVEGETEAATTEVIVLEDGTEEVHTIRPQTQDVYRFADERILAIEDKAREKIYAILDEINRLEDRSDEGELQKEIERIKLDAEIARFKMLMQDAEDAEDFDLADELWEEIEHLETVDQTVIGVPQEQPAL